MPNIKSIPLKTKELQRYKMYTIGTPMATPWLRYRRTPEIPQSRIQYATMEQAIESTVRQAKRELGKHNANVPLSCF